MPRAAHDPVTDRSRRCFIGQPLDLLSLDETVAEVSRFVHSGQPGAHLGINASNFCLAKDEPGYLRHLFEADLVTADGQSVVWAGRLLGLPVPERVTGIDLMQALLEASKDHGWMVYLLGATADVVVELARQLESDGIAVAGYRDGYFPPSESKNVLDEVANSGATLLFVGLPSPMKERFIIECARPGGIPFSVGVGGSFDVLSGQLQRAPVALRRLGLEWAFRMTHEPRRLFKRYAVTNTRFFGAVLAALVAKRLR